MIRHYNMHKKRDNSLQHGFMRFSPLDDCSVYYHGCHLNGKSTHYHCMQVPPTPTPPFPPLPDREPPFLPSQVPARRRGAGGESWGLGLGQRRVGQGGAFAMAILGEGEIQGAVYTDRHFSGFSTKSGIANDS